MEKLERGLSSEKIPKFVVVVVKVEEKSFLQCIRSVRLTGCKVLM